MADGSLGGGEEWLAMSRAYEVEVRWDSEAGSWIAKSDDPVFVSLFGSDIRLRIGEKARGRTRRASLNPSDARLVAYALLARAEEIEANREP